MAGPGWWQHGAGRSKRLANGELIDNVQLGGGIDGRVSRFRLRLRDARSLEPCNWALVRDMVKSK